MKNNDNGSATGSFEKSKLAEHVADAEVLTDEDTAELPTLDLADVDETINEAPDKVSVRAAASSVMDVRGEVDRLQRQWESLGEKLSEANGNIASLQAEIEEKDASLAELVDDLDSMQQQSAALEAEIAVRDETVSSLEEALAERGEEVTEVSDSLAKANSRAEALEDRLEAAKQEVEGLRSSLQDAKSNEATLSAEKDAIVASQANLRTKLQDQEIYLEGRREKWIDQQASLKSSESEIKELKSALERSESRFDERDKTIASLQTRIGELEHELGAFEGRDSERAAAQSNAQELLQEQIGETERLKAELDQASANNGQAEIESLKITLKEKDESIRSLEDDIGKFEAVKTHIEEQQESDRATINDLQQALAQAESERNRLSEKLEDGQVASHDLAEKLESVEDAAADLRIESAEQKERIASLEKELELRTEIIAGFNENAEKLNQLKQSMDAESNEQRETKFDFSDADLEAVRDEMRVQGDSSLDQAAMEQRHAIIDLSGYSRTAFPISKPVTTIGRSSASDICVKDDVVSRLHAILQLDDKGLTIEDHDSRNGLLVNQSRVKRAVLKDGDIVTIGTHYFRYADLEQHQPTH